MSWFNLASGLKTNGSEARKALGGVWEFYKSGDVSAEARRAVLDLHCKTNGTFTDGLAALMRRLYPAHSPKPVTGLLGTFSVEQQQGIAAQIERDGYYKFETRIPEDLCDEIFAFGQRTPCLVEGRSRDVKDREIFDPANPISITYRVVEEDIIENPAMQRLMADPVFPAIAERYLKFHPMLSMMNLWWSATFGDKPGEGAAQEFHFDFDPPPQWLLVFVYLTDVGPDNGPHVYAKGTHKAGLDGAAEILSRGYVRIPDEHISGAFGPDSIVELHGKRGTVLAVDTRGFHKGKMLTQGHRLISQLTFSSPPFSGAHARKRKLPAVIHPDLAKAVRNDPKAYQKYT